ncbi:hypothetical protein [Denitrobacterium detoxificans]|uniref:Uncharacterized protein n=1 Tax=Denitrobacterium detoxificans TaxID=79604 RepID=A0A1H8TN63_9ACTN|nr:hypothetical protein [Denitrobacterium detoxificans]SEO92412.1 hypothetical protein SAMN02910314_01650 [Denitrobacterium detoxificans]
MSRGTKTAVAALAVFGATMTLLVSIGGNPMEGEYLQKIAIAIAPTAVTLCGGWIASITKRMEEEERRREERAEEEERRREERAEKEAEKREAERMALRALLRNELVRMHREWVEQKGYITLEALEYARQTYEAYHAIGGNGTGTKLFEDMEALQIKEERN